MYIVFAILIFSILILVHELGHFTVAKLCGVQVNEFSIFMGPKLLQKKHGETKYTLRLIPVGGYCAMEGEDEQTDNPRAFTTAKLYKRLLILIAGSFTNFLLGFLVTVIVIGCTATSGFATLEITGFMDICTVNQEGGLQQGDKITAIDGSRTYLFSDFSMLMERNPGDIHDLTVERDGKRITLESLDMQKHEVTDEQGRTSLMYGLKFGVIEPANVGTVLKNSWYQCLDFTRLVWYGLSDLISGRASLDDAGGPVQIVSIIAQTGEQAADTKSGILDVLYLGAFIAVNLAVMNMLPIPALDGGRVFFLLFNALFTLIFRKKINPKYEGYVHAAGMVLLLGFMAFITVKDVIGLF